MGCPSSREKTMLFDGSSTDVEVVTVYTKPHNYYVARAIIWLCYRREDLRVILYIFRNLPNRTRRAIPKKALVDINNEGLFFLTNLDVFSQKEKWNLIQ
jgi:hypothetical protein